MPGWKGDWYICRTFDIMCPMSEDRKRIKRRKKLRRKLLRVIPFVVALLLIVIVIAVSMKLGLLEKYSYSYDKVDLNEYFGLTSPDQIPLMLDNKYSVGALYKEDDKYYLLMDMVSELFDDNYYYNEAEKMMLYTTGTENNVLIEGKDYIIRNNSDVFLSIDVVSEYAGMKIVNYSEPERVEIIYNRTEEEISEATVTKNTQCRVLGGIKSEVLTDIIKGSKVCVLSAMDEWSEVKTEDGFIGYVENKVLDDYNTKTLSPIEAKKAFSVPHNLYNEKICLGWHQVMSRDANQTIETVVAQSKGMNVISPTWFTVGDNEGNISSIASVEYVNYAHERGIKVWALVDNFLSDVNMYQILSNTASRVNLEKQLINAAAEATVDGINIDFENLDVECGPHFAQFIRELSLECHQNNLVLSVDNYVPKEYTSFYHREVQGRFADYVIIMGYDEHYSGSKEAGSVASFDYVREGIEKTLEDVDASQVINGIPFYTRIWHEGASLDSEAVGMNEAEAYLSNRGVTPVWDDITAQNYAQFSDSDGRNCEVWLEDEFSIAAKLNLVETNNLAGVAFWKLGLEKASIWDTVATYLNK